MPKHKIHEVKTISTHRSYHGWPTVARLKNGELLVAVSAGREKHVCPFGQVHLIRSVDNGQNWMPSKVLVNGPLDDRDAGIIQTRAGTILVNWFTSVAAIRYMENAENEGNDALHKLGNDGYISRCRKIRSLLTEETTRRELGTWMLRSVDGGKTWSEKIDCGAGSPHGPTELLDGRILFVGNFKYDEFSQQLRAPYSPILGATLSEDDGLTWKKRGIIPQRPGDEPGTYHEPHAVQTLDGRIIVHIRNHSQQDKYHLLQSESSDGGQTFSVPRDTGVAGFPAHLLRLRDGRLLCTYGYRVLPYGNRAVISEDAGKTWSKPMILDEKPVQRDLGYSSSVELEDGSILSVWYELLPNCTLTSVQATRWSLI